MKCVLCGCNRHIIHEPRDEMVRRITCEVSRDHVIPVKLLVGNLRTAPVCEARDELAYRLRTEVPMMLIDVAEYLGDRHHTTIINSVRNHIRRMVV